LFVTKESVEKFNSGKYQEIPMNELAQIIKTNFPELKEDFLQVLINTEMDNMIILMGKTFKGKQIVYEN